MNPTEMVDLFVIGGGSGGVRAARIAAGLGLRVILAESGPMGGTCVNVGCVPKKLMVYASEFAASFEDAEGFGWTVGSPVFSLSALKTARDNEVRRLNGIYDQMLGNAGVTIVRGHASLVNAQCVSVDGREYPAKRILIATGGRPVPMTIEGASLMENSNAFFDMAELPRRVVVIGGGFIALEFATILRGFGVDVTLVHRGDKLLRGFDEEIREFVTDQISNSAVTLKLMTEVLAVKRTGEGLVVSASDGTETVVDRVFTAVGRSPNTASLNLDAVGVDTDSKGYVTVNDQFQTSIPSVYAVGDVTRTIQLTPVALAQGMAFAQGIAGIGDGRVDLGNVPSVVFCQPAVGSLGLTEALALVAGHRCRVYTSSFRPMKGTLSGRTERSFMKLIVDDDDDRVLGVHVVSPDAAEMLQGFAVGMTCGMTHRQLLATIGIHPSSAEELVTMRTPTRTPISRV